MQVELKYRVLIGVSAMTLLFISFLIAFISSQRKKQKHRLEVEKLREIQQNQLLEAAIRSEEIERHRIAEALHDEVGAILSSAKLHIFGIKANTLDGRDAKLHEKGKELLDEAIQKVRGISHNLHSNILKEFGLNEAIQHFIKKITEGSLVTSIINLDENFKTINFENDISIYRLIQELMNNIIKHSGATFINLTSTLSDDTLHFTINHNGNGLTNEQFERLRYNKNGMGLKNIQNRVILLKGKLEFVKVENGYDIIFEVPVNVVYE